MRLGNICLLLIQLYFANVSSLRGSEMEFLEKMSLNPAQINWILEEFSVFPDDESVGILKDILLDQTLPSGPASHPHDREKRDLDEGLYRNFNITKIGKPSKSQLKLDQLDVNHCKDQVMSQVFELGGKSIFVAGNHLFLVDEQLEVAQYKELFSTDFHFTIRLTEGVIVNNELYIFQIVSTGNTPRKEMVNCEDLVYSSTHYTFFRVSVNNNDFEIEELSDLDLDDLDLEDDIKNTHHVRAALAYLEEEKRIVIVAFHHIIGKNLLDYLHFRVGHDSALVREGHQIKYPDTVRDLELLTTVGSVKQNFMVLAKDGTIELYHLVDTPQNLLVQEIEIANTKNIHFFANRWGNYLLALDGASLARVFWFDGDQFIQIQSFVAEEAKVFVDNTFVDEQQMVVLGTGEGEVEFYQFVMPGVMRQVVPMEEMDTADVKVSTLNLGRTVTQEGFKYFVLSLGRSDDGKFSFQTSLVEIGRVASSRGESGDEMVDKNGESDVDEITDSALFTGPGGLVMTLEVAIEEDDWLLKQVEETQDEVIHLNQTLFLVDSTIDVVSSTFMADSTIDVVTSNSNLSPNLTIGILLETFDGFDRINNTYDSLSDIEISTSTLNMSDNEVFNSTVFKTKQQKSYNIDGIIFNSVLALENGKAKNVTTERINGFNLDDALTKTLKIYEDQNIYLPFSFEEVIVDNTKISKFTNNFIDGSKQNELSKPLTFKNIVLEDDSILEDSKINNINISDIIRKSDLDSSSEENPVEISGIKSFESVLKTKGILASAVNDKDWVAWYDKVLFKEGQELQVIETKKVNLATVNVIKLANIDMLDDTDVTLKVLDDIARTDEKLTFENDVVFSNDINVKNLVSNTINHFSPDDFLVDGKVQTVSQKMDISSLEASKIVHKNLLNGINLKEVATIPGPNEFASKVTFQDITVTDLLDVKDGKTLDNVDVSVFRILNAFSRGIIYIRKSLTINGTNITNLTFGDFPHEFISEKTMRDQFLFKNYDQELPNLIEFDSLVNVSFKNLTIKKTLDNLKLDEVVHTSSDESIDRTITFMFPTTFMEKVEVTGDSSTVGGVDVPKLLNSTAYDFPNSNVTIYGKKNVAHIESQENVQLAGSFSHLARDLGKFSDNLVKLNSPNIFMSNVSFSHKFNKPSLNVSTIKTNNVTADDEGQVEVNGKNLFKFVETIVRNGQDESRDVSGQEDGSGDVAGEDYTYISSDVGFRELVNGIGRIDSTGGNIDGENLVEYAQKRILHNDMAIERSIIIPNAKFQKDLIILVNGSGILSDEDASGDLSDEDGSGTINDEERSYFSGQDLWEYVEKLYLASSAKPITGKKTLTGNVTIDGNLNVFDSLDNENFAFDTNLPLLEEEYLSRSKQQAIYLKYNLGSISGVDTLDVPIVDGVDVSNFCFIDEHCNIRLDGETLEFTGNVVLGDLEGQVRTGGAVFKEDFSESFSHNLDSLEDVHDIVWQNNGNISHLYENLVVKSDYDYGTNSKYQCPENCQEISGTVTFSGEFEAKEILIQENSKINDGKSQIEVDLNIIKDDCAWISKENIFTATKEFKGNLSASAAKIGQLSDTSLINNVDLKQFRSEVLVKEPQDQSQDFTQTINGSWFISNGFSVMDIKVGGVIDNLRVEDLVRKNHVELERSIPKVRLAKGFNLTGNLNINGSEIEKLFENAIRLDEHNENIEMDMNFTDNLEFTKDLIVDYIDEIPMHEVVKTNVDMSKQTISGSKKILASVNVKTNIGKTFLNGLSLDDFNEDSLRIDREETITLNNITFEREVKMFEVNIPGKVKVGLEAELLSAMKSFTEKLYNFYDEQVVKPLRHFLNEVAVGEMLSFGEVETLERQETPEKYQIQENTHHVDTIRLNEAEWSLPSKVLELSDDDDICLTTKSRYASSVSDKTEMEDVNAFMFTLESGLWTVTSTNQRYKDGCMLPKDNQVVVTGLINPEGKYDLNVETMAEQIYVTDISNITGTENSVFGYIEDVVMWESGNGQFLMAIACSYPKENIQILMFDKIWFYVQEISPSQFEGLSGFKNMHANIIETTEDEDIQLIVTSQDDDEDNILFFSFNQTGTMFELKQTIPYRHISGLALMNTQPTPYIESGAMMVVASEMQYSNYEFRTEILVYKYNNDTKLYDLDDHSHKLRSRGVEIVQMKIKEISGYQILFLAETDQIKMLKFVPNQGFQLLSWAKIKGILDINLYEESLETSEGGPGTIVMIHVTSKEDEELHTTVLSAFVEGKILSISKTLPYLPSQRKTKSIVNGAYSPWSQWSPCSKSCGNDVPQSRTRQCNNPTPSVGGRTCKGTNREYQSCNQHPCPVHGSWSDWKNWSSCSTTCGEEGVKTKTRVCDNPAPSVGGRTCAGKGLLVEACRDPCCARDGGWSLWGSWTECYRACEVDSLGTKKRTRECNAPTRKCGGQECQGADVEIVPCEKECPVLFTWESWGEWGSCSKSCGDGAQRRFRECSSGDETSCVGSKAEYRFCNEGICGTLSDEDGSGVLPEVDGNGDLPDEDGSPDEDGNDGLPDERSNSGGPTSTEGSISPRPTSTEGSTSARPTSTEGSTSARPTSTEGSTSATPTSTEGSTSARPTSTEGSNIVWSTSTEGSTIARPTSTEGSTIARSTSTEGSTSARPTSTDGSTSARPTSTEVNTNGRLTSTEGNTSAKPTSTDGSTSARPTSTEGNTSARPTSTEGNTSSRPTSTDESTSAQPTSTEESISAWPTSTEGSTSARPTSTEGSTSARPTSTEGSTSSRGTLMEGSTSVPPSSPEGITSIPPTSTNGSSSAWPISTEGSPSARPISTEESTSAKPTSTDINTSARLTSTGTSSSARPTLTEGSTSAHSTSTKGSSSTQPTSTERSTSARPTSTDRSTSARPTLTEGSTRVRQTSTEGSTSTPQTTTEESSSARPTSIEPSSSTRPTSTEGSTSARPTSTEGSSSARPTSTEGSSSAWPTSTEGSTTARPTSTEGSSSARPTSTEESTSARSTLTEGSSSAGPTSTDGSSSARPTSTKKGTSVRPTSTAGITNTRSNTPTTMREGPAATTREGPTQTATTMNERPTPTAVIMSEGSSPTVATRSEGLTEATPGTTSEGLTSTPATTGEGQNSTPVNNTKGATSTLATTNAGQTSTSETTSAKKTSTLATTNAGQTSTSESNSAEKTSTPETRNYN